jgi:thiamine biosynthesis lipoprotein
VAAVLRLEEGGVATSGTTVRRWVAPDGSPAHHLIDPRTGRPTRTPLVAATVVAGTAAWAEAWTKAVMVRGDDALDALDDLQLAALAVRTDGHVVVNRTWARFGELTAPVHAATGVGA